MARGSRQQRLMFDFHDALSSSLDLPSVIEAAFPLLAQLISVDCGALCVSNPDSAGGYDWAMVDFPVDWFSAYGDMVPHDFVRRAVLATPNVVMRDSEMLSRTDLEANMMYQRARDLRVPLEQVMSVMLDLRSSWHAGITLYRGRRRPFSDTHRALLQQVTPWVANAVRNCKLFAEESRRGNILDSILNKEGLHVMLMSPRLAPLALADGAASLIARWFDRTELDRTGLPVILLDRLKAVAQRHREVTEQPVTWTRSSSGGSQLHVMFVPITESAHQTVWAIVLRETDRVPSAWKRVLTPTEAKVVSRVLLGWDNQLIADDIGCKLPTVKSHLQHIFDKLGAPNRATLCNLASQRDAGIQSRRS